MARYTAYNPEHNLLTANQASVETDVGDYTVLTACSKTQSAVFSASGSQSLCLTVVGTPSEISCAQTGGTAGRPVTGNQKYTLSAFSRTAATIRPVKIGVNWFTSGGTAIGTTVYGSTLNNSPSNFTARPFVTAVAPSNAAFASIVLNVGGGPLVNNEAHYFDQMALNEGDPLSTWVAGGTPATGNLATVSVALMSATGAALSSPDKTEVVAYLKGLREIGFTVYAIDPSITTINVAYSFKPVTGVDANTVISLIDAALTTYLTGTNWGRNPAVSESTDWVNSNTVRQYELVTLINEIGGVDYVSTVTINGAPSDLAITGPAPTTSVGTIVGTAI
ncbi:MAG: hypothetical protein JHC87_09640 [Thermoleophilaceae bacterium]|nr:hypothetical protein [Thermoleophilaceae bacterium]